MGFFTVQITYFSWVAVNETSSKDQVQAHGRKMPSPLQAVLASIGMYLVAVLLSAIPFFPSTSGFVYTAEGFCFLDYYDQGINTLFAFIMVASFIVVWTLTLKINRALAAPGYTG